MTEDARERQVFFDAWGKFIASKKLNAMEKKIVKTIQMHPEFETVVADPNKYAGYEFETNETEPFAHMAMHLIVKEMIALDDPEGLRALYDATVQKVGEKHTVQHKIIEALFDWMVGNDTFEMQIRQDSDFLQHIENYCN